MKISEKENKRIQKGKKGGQASRIFPIKECLEAYYSGRSEDSPENLRKDFEFNVFLQKQRKSKYKN